MDARRNSIQLGFRRRGIGLRAIRQRVASLGGLPSVESALGEGTALAVTIPILDPAEATASRPEVSA
jgi:signal transduction histidine kinase